MDKPPKSSLLKVDDTFASYQDLRQALERYENANRVQFWKRDAKKLHRASPKVYEIIKNRPQLEYCSIKFACIHGGQNFRPKNILAARQRRSRGTWKHNCKAEILVSLSDEKTRLVVKKIVDEHNHEIPSEEVFKQFPKNRRNAKRQKVTDRLPERSVRTVQDKQNILDNLVRANSLARSNNLKRIGKVLQEKYDCTVDLQTDKDDKVYGFFFQDCQMKKCFDMFPEILLMDGTYKLLNIGCSIYVLSVENSFGTSDVVGIAVLTVEDKPSADWMIDRFKERNPRWEEIGIVVTDRLSSEYKLAPNHFPQARRLICISHALHVFRKDTVLSKVLNVTPTESDTCFEFFNRLTHSDSEEEYNTILEDMEDNVSFSLMQYFFKNWHSLRHDWCNGFIGPIRKYIDCKFESPNSKLKSTIGNCKTFSRFVENLFLVLYIKRNELQREFGKMITKIPTSEESLAEKNYNQYLTPYACSKIKPHLISCEIEASEMSYSEDSDVICQTKDSTFVVSELTCNCDFFTLLKLPCKHLLGYRKLKGMDLFDEYLFSQRWTRKYIQDLIDGKKFSLKTQQEKSCEERFEEAQSVCLSLAGLCSEVGDKFEERINQLLQLQDLWQNNDTVIIRKVDTLKNDHDYLNSRVENMEIETLL